MLLTLLLKYVSVQCGVMYVGEHYGGYMAERKFVILGYNKVVKIIKFNFHWWPSWNFKMADIPKWYKVINHIIILIIVHKLNNCSYSFIHQDCTCLKIRQLEKLHFHWWPFRKKIKSNRLIIPRYDHPECESMTAARHKYEQPSRSVPKLPRASHHLRASHQPMMPSSFWGAFENCHREKLSGFQSSKYEFCYVWME